MKAKLLLILLSTLFIVPLNAKTLNKRKHKAIRNIYVETKNWRTRAPFVFDIDVQEVNNCLQIIFLSSLPDAEISITDKDGNIVVHEPQAYIHEGKILYIYNSNDCPYTIKITSPTADIIGEIIEDETE